MPPRNPAFTRMIHLLSTGDVSPSPPAAELVRADGSRQPVSANLLAAMEHLVQASAAGQSVLVRPLNPTLWVRDAASVTALDEDRLRELISEGRLPATPSALGDIVQLTDVVALDNEFREMRDETLQEMFDDSYAGAASAAHPDQVAALIERA